MFTDVKWRKGTGKRKTKKPVCSCPRVGQSQEEEKFPLVS